MSGPILTQEQIDECAAGVARQGLHHTYSVDIARAVAIAQAERIAEWLEETSGQCRCDRCAGRVADAALIRAAIKAQKEEA